MRTGWATHEQLSGLSLRTVSTTRIGAMVNWLAIRPGIVVQSGAPEALIEQLWAVASNAAGGVEIVEVARRSTTTRSRSRRAT